jgi:hypothetical protein
MLHCSGKRLSQLNRGHRAALTFITWPRLVIGVAVVTGQSGRD